MRKSLVSLVLVALLGGVGLSAAPAQEGLGEKIGERLDRGLRELRSELKQEWAEIRRSVERLSVQGRVYSRLRWDKDMRNTSIEIEAPEENVILLQGRVPTAEIKEKALDLARDTVGVESVVDQLTVAEPTP
ncbi:MAG: BON domain-containing protein [Planctomycetes bacterium]|nr:BON domain-containing protein [Planctomycetota bacterium]